MSEGKDFDVCGAWLMRAFADGDKVRAFYHAERACSYLQHFQILKMKDIYIYINIFDFEKIFQ